MSQRGVLGRFARVRAPRARAGPSPLSGCSCHGPPRAPATRALFTPARTLVRHAISAVAPACGQPARRLSSTTSPHERAESSQEKRPSGRRWIVVLAGLCALSGVFLIPEERRLRLVFGKPLNPETFVPFRVVAKEPVSSTSFILTLRPWWSLGPRPLPPQEDAPAGAVDDPFSSGSGLPPLLYGLLVTAASALSGRGDGDGGWPRHANGAVLARAWAHGLWSAEVKQPQLQIARDYTPLPPRRPAGGAGAADAEREAGDLRFLVRRYERGEVSTYLARLGVGDRVELRGPHHGFDVPARLGGEGAAVVFLAGGTGVAPAMQAAHRLAAEGRGAAGGAPSVSILWANRRREDCAGCGGGQPGPIVQQLREMQERYPGALRVRCLVDEERSFLGARDVLRAVQEASPGPRRGGAAAAAAVDAAACPLHAQGVTERSTGEDEPAAAPCACTAHAPGPVAAGRNLVMVSGPEGFVGALAGPKRWAGGHELQGPVRGVVGDLRARHPDLFRDWLVLKL